MIIDMQSFKSNLRLIDPRKLGGGGWGWGRKKTDRENKNRSDQVLLVIEGKYKKKLLQYLLAFLDILLLICVHCEVGTASW